MCVCSVRALTPSRALPPAPPLLPPTTNRQGTKQSLKGAKESVKRMNRQQAEEARRLSNLLVQQKHDVMHGDNARRHALHQSVKMTHEQQKAKEAKRRYDHELHLRATFEAKVREEKARKEEAEKIIAKFEAEEAKLIGRLKSTQVAQHGALTQLEKTLLSP